MELEKISAQVSKNLAERVRSVAQGNNVSTASVIRGCLRVSLPMFENITGLLAFLTKKNEESHGPKQ
jgi:hypothetical protein